MLIGKIIMAAALATGHILPKPPQLHRRAELVRSCLYVLLYSGVIYTVEEVGFQKPICLVILIPFYINPAKSN